MANLKKKVVSSLVWKFLERAGHHVIQLVVQIVLARILAPAEFGMLAIMIVFINVGNVFVQSGLNTALVQDPDADDDDFSTIFWLSLGISLVLYFGLFFAAPSVEDFYQLDGLATPLRVLCILLIINAYNSIQVAYTSRNLSFKPIFVASIISIIVSGALGIGIAVMGGGIWALVAQQLSYQIINCVVLAIQVPWKPKLVFIPKRAKVLFQFGWKLLIIGLLETGYQSISDLIIGKQFSADSLGYVSQGKKYPQAFGGMLNGAIQPVMTSAIARVQEDKAQVKRMMRRSIRTSTFVVIPFMVCFALVAEPLILIVFGEKWLPAVPFFQLYCLFYGLLPINSSNVQALNGMGRSDLNLMLELIKKSIGVLILLITAFVIKDLTAIVVGYLIAAVLNTFINAQPIQRVVGYFYLEQLKDIFPSVVLSAIAAAIAWPISFLAIPSAAVLGLQVIAMILVYALLSKKFNPEPFSYLKATISEMKPRKGN